MRCLNFTLLIIAMAASLICEAQAPVIKYENVVKPGYKAYLYQYINSGLNEGPGGTDLTWNFTADSSFLTPYDSASYFQVINPYTSPFISRFPGANFCVKICQNKQTNYKYIIMSPQSYRDTADILISDTSQTLYPITKAYMKFPFNYGDVWTTTHQEGNNAVIYDTITYDAYGTLITSLGTFTNVVRTKTIRGSGLVKYTWWSTNPVFRIFVMGEGDPLLMLPATLSDNKKGGTKRR